jgi:hypothetical protein
MKQRGAPTKPRRRVSALPAVILLAACLPALASAMSLKPLTAAELGRVRAHEAAVVLVQLNVDIAGKRVSPTHVYDTNKLARFYLARLDDLEAPKLVFPGSPSEAAANAGWRYLVLSPGTYYLLVLPPGVEQNPPAIAYSSGDGRYGRLTRYEFTPGRGGFWSPELGGFVFGQSPPPDFEALPGYWFQVPAKSEVVYLGSLAVACKGGRGLFGSLIDSCTDFDLADDERAAKELVSSSLSGLALDALPLVPYGKPRAGLRVPDLNEIEVTMQTPPGMTAAFTGAELAPWGVVHGTGQAVGLYNLLAMGGRLLGEASAEHRADKQAADIQSCIERLSAAVSSRDLAADFSSALARALRPPPVTDDHASRSETQSPESEGRSNDRMTASLRILQLRESGRENELALELGLDVRLEAADTGRLDYYTLLVYGPGPSAAGPNTPHSPLYSRLVAARATPRLVSEWCDAGGAQILNDDISVALEQIAAQVTHDLE